MNGPLVGTGDALKPGVTGTNASAFGVGVAGSGPATGVIGTANDPNTEGAVGVVGIGGAIGVRGATADGVGIGVLADGDSGHGLLAKSNSGNGVVGQSTSGDGVSGSTNSSAQSGIFGFNGAGGEVPVLDPPRPTGNGVWGHTTVEKGSGVVGSVDPNLGQASKAAGVTGIGPIAGQFFGDVVVTGDVKLVGGDCAEEFDASVSAIDPGAVVVLDDDGTVRPSNSPYDKRVAGVVSGAGDYKPALILDRHDSDRQRVPVSFLGKVYCKVDAEYGSIRVGDLLTTSPTLGHAMKVSEPFNAFGAVIGKALRSLERGQGLIPMLVALQ